MKLLALAISLTVSAMPGISQVGVSILNSMFGKVKSVNQISFNITAKERFGNEYTVQKAFIKKQSAPLRIYYKQLHPETGAEVLINGIYTKKALVNPNSFPWANLYLDPDGKTLREGQHHNIYEAGFDYLVNILDSLTGKYKSEADKLIQYKGTVTWQDAECYKIELNNPHFMYYKYKVNEETSAALLAKKLYIGDYLILEKNTFLKHCTDKIRAGTELVLPNDYAKRLLILIDKKIMLPVYMEIYDDTGLLEQYHFSGININPSFTENDFSEFNKDYGFK